MVRAYHLRRVIVELIKKNIHMEQRIKWAASQISLEEDQNISDQKPDAYKIICKNACVKVEETKPVEEAVWIKGALEYKVFSAGRGCGKPGEKSA